MKSELRPWNTIFTLIKNLKEQNKNDSFYLDLDIPCSCNIYYFKNVLTGEIMGSTKVYPVWTEAFPEAILSVFVHKQEVPYLSEIFSSCISFWYIVIVLFYSFLFLPMGTVVGQLCRQSWEWLLIIPAPRHSLFTLIWNRARWGWISDAQDTEKVLACHFLN